MEKLTLRNLRCLFKKEQTTLLLTRFAEPSAPAIPVRPLKLPARSPISFIYSGPTSAGAILQALLSEIVVPECKMPRKSIRTAVSEFID